MNAKDLEVLDLVRRRHRHAWIQGLSLAGMAVFLASGAALFAWGAQSLDALKGGKWEAFELLLDLVQINQLQGAAFFALGAAFCATLWEFGRERRRSDALLLKLADERMRDLDVPR